MIHIAKAFYKISRKSLNLSIVHLVFTNYKLCIIKCILSVTFTAIILQEHQKLSSHNYQFTRYYINSKSCYYEIYICVLYTVSPSLNKPYGIIKMLINNLTAYINNSYSDIIKLLTEIEAYTGNPCFIKPNIALVISPSIDVPYIDMFLWNIIELYINCDRVAYHLIFKHEIITYVYYFDSQVPYLLSLIFILFIIVKLCAIITSLIHILDIIFIMFIVSLLYLYINIFKMASIMYLIIIISAQNLYINAELQYQINSVLTKELYIIKCIHCIHCNGINGNLRITNNVINQLLFFNCNN